MKRRLSFAACGALDACAAPRTAASPSVGRFDVIIATARSWTESGPWFYGDVDIQGTVSFDGPRQLSRDRSPGPSIA